jgi:hypothetical protein
VTPVTGAAGYLLYVALLTVVLVLWALAAWKGDGR